jgi:hypothetical protein
MLVGRTYPRKQKYGRRDCDYVKQITPPERPALLNCLRSLTVGQNTRFGSERSESNPHRRV